MQGQGRLGSQRHSGSSRLSKPSTCDATWHRCSGSTQQSQWERRANWVVRLPARTSPCTPTGAAPRQVLCKTSTSASDAFISPTEVASFLQGLADKEAQHLPQNTGDIVFVQTLSKQQRAKIKAAEERATQLGLSTNDLRLRLQELCLLLPGATETELMTAPSLDSHALLDLCLDTAKVAARLVEFSSRYNGGDALATLRQQPELLTDQQWNLHFMPCSRLRGHSGWTQAVAITQDGRFALSGGADNVVKVWELRTRSCTAQLTGHEQYIAALAVTPDGKLAVSGSNDDTLRIWDLQMGVCRSILRGHYNGISAVAITPDGRFAVSGSADKALCVWDLSTGGQVATLWGHTHAVTCVAVSSDGRRAVSGSKDGTLRIWCLDTYACLATLASCAHSGPSGWVGCVAVTRDGRYAVAGLSDSTFQMWDLERYTEVETPPPPRARIVTAIAVCFDGRYALLAGSDNTLSMFDLQTRTFMPALTGHNAGLLAVAVSGDGYCAVTGSADTTVCLWQRGVLQ